MRNSALVVLGLFFVVSSAIVLSYVGQPPTDCKDDGKRKWSIGLTSVMLVVGVLLFGLGGYHMYSGNTGSNKLRSFVC